MDTTKETPEIKRNPETYQKHRKEFLWQILVPLVIGSVLILALMGLSVSSGIQTRLADIALIWLILPVLFGALFSLILLVALIYGMLKLTGVIPVGAVKILDVLNQVKTGAQQVDDRLVLPVIKLKATTASIRKFKQQVFRK